MDINGLKTRPVHDAGAELVIKGPDGKKTDFVVTVVGVDSSRFESILRDSELKKLKGEKTSVPELLSDVVISWRGLENDGMPVEFSKETALDLFKNAPYICDQIDTFISDRKNFSMPKPKR